MRDPLHWMSVKHKLTLAFAGLCLLAFGVGGFLISRSARSVLEEQIGARIWVQSRASARALDDGLRLLRRRTEDFASDGYLRERFAALVASKDVGEEEDLRADLTRHLRENKLPLVPAFVGLTLVSESGEVLVHTDHGRTPVAPSVISDALATDGLRHSDLLPNALDGAPLQAISTPLRELHGGESVGRLIAWIDPAVWVTTSLEGIYPIAAENVARHTPMDLRILDRQGASLTPPDTRKKLGSTPVLRSSPRVGGSGEDGIPIRENGWHVRLSLRNLDAYAPVSGLQSRFLGVGVVLAALCALLLFFPMRFLVKPLSDLREAARRIRAGDYSVRVTADSEDEVGDLARSFNHMAEAVEQKTTRLEGAAAELRAGQRELRAQHERLDTVIRTLRDALVVVDADGSPVLGNAAAKPLMDMLASGDERLTSHYVCRQQDGARACTACLLQRDETTSTCVLDVGDRVLEVHVTQLPPDSDGRRGRVLLARDISERIARDERDIHRERLSVLGEVAAVMAHELNNPLTSIRMFAQMLVDSLPVESPFREHADVIVRNTETCRHSIRELLGYATGSTPETGPVPVHDVLQDVVHFVRPLADRARVSVETHLAASSDVVNGDEIQVRQLFVNLVLNAVQAARSTAAQPSPVTVTLATSDDGGAIFVDVTDTGPGLPEEAQERAFDAFFSTKPRGEGTGLGLPTARRIAELHGGGLELIESAPGRTVFRVRLRMAPQVTEEVPA